MDRMYGGSNADSLRPGAGIDDEHERELLEIAAAQAHDKHRVFRRRLSLAAAAGMILVTGLVVHFVTVGVVGDFVADALYAVMVYLMLSFILVRRPSWQVAIVAIVVCVGIELFQLTGVPADLARAFPPARLVLGTTFTPVDLVAYVFGVVAAAAVNTWRRLD